jgi:membrane protease YdiL (CAAX protease family)
LCPGANKTQIDHREANEMTLSDRSPVVVSDTSDATTTIEEQIRGSRGLLIGSTLLGLAAVASDFAIVLAGRTALFPRLLLGTIVLLAYVQIVAKYGAGTVPGFRLPSREEWKRWLLLFGGAAVGLAIVVIVGRRWFPSHFAPPPPVSWLAVYACIVWPIYEETVYRVALCTPSAAVAGRTGAIVVNGLVFAALHVAYGNPDPSNAVGGFVLAWIFLRSRSVLVCITAHSIGNFAINFTPILFGRFL